MKLFTVGIICITLLCATLNAHNNNKEKKAILIVSPTFKCTFCEKAIQYGKDNNVPVFIRKVDLNTEKKENIRGYPMITVVSIEYYVQGFGSDEKNWLEKELDL